MASIVVDDRLLSLLKADAKSHGVEIETRAAQILSDALGSKTRRLTLLEEANRIAAMTPKGVKQTDSVELIREDRDR
jgi:DNA polymerase III delta subunit